MKTLNDIIAGDLVIKQSDRVEYVKVVKRVTNTQIVLSNKNIAGEEWEEKFSKKNGDIVGSVNIWSRTFIRIGTNEGMAKIVALNKLRGTIEYCQKYPWHKLPIETLEQIKSLLPEIKT